LHQRKQEVSENETARQRAGYRALAMRTRNSYTIDASQSLDNGVNDVERIILEHMARSLEHALGRRGVPRQIVTEANDFSPSGPA
jgi:hypothetical protein